MYSVINLYFDFSLNLEISKLEVEETVISGFSTLISGRTTISSFITFSKVFWL